MTPGFQLYSAREHGPWSEVFATLARLGYRHVEGYGALYDDVDAVAGAMAEHGLDMPSGHFAITALEDDPEATFETARRLGTTLLVCPHLATEARPRDAAGWREFGRRLARVGERAEAEGFGFAWHNHDFELAPLADGTVPLEVLLEEASGIGWEADLAWIARAGADPAEWARRYGGRAVAVHVKDLAPEGENADEDGWADVGRGTLDWRALIDAFGGGERHWIVEHDKPSDLERFAARSMDWLEANAGAKRG